MHEAFEELLQTLRLRLEESLTWELKRHLIEALIERILVNTVDKEKQTIVSQRSYGERHFALHAHPRSVLNGFRNMIGRDQVASGQIGNRAGKLQHTMVGTRRKVQLLHGRFHQFFG